MKNDNCTIVDAIKTTSHELFWVQEEASLMMWCTVNYCGIIKNSWKGKQIWFSLSPLILMWATTVQIYDVANNGDRRCFTIYYQRFSIMLLILQIIGASDDVSTVWDHLEGDYHWEHLYFQHFAIRLAREERHFETPTNGLSSSDFIKLNRTNWNILYKWGPCNGLIEWTNNYRIYSPQRSDALEQRYRTTLSIWTDRTIFEIVFDSKEMIFFGLTRLRKRHGGIMCHMELLEMLASGRNCWREIQFFFVVVLLSIRRRRRESIDGCSVDTELTTMC